MNESLSEPQLARRWAIPIRWLALSSAALYGISFIGQMFDKLVLTIVCALPAIFLVGGLFVLLDQQLLSKWKESAKARAGTYRVARLAVIITLLVGFLIGWLALCVSALEVVTLPDGAVEGAITLCVAITALSISYLIRRILSEQYGVLPTLRAQSNPSHEKGRWAYWIFDWIIYPLILWLTMRSPP